MAVILIILAKFASLTLFKIKTFWNKGYDNIISVHAVTNKIFITWTKLNCRCGHVTKVW